MFIVVKPWTKNDRVDCVRPQDIGQVIAQCKSEEQAFELARVNSQLIYVQVDRKGRLVQDTPAYQSTRLN